MKVPSASLTGLRVGGRGFTLMELMVTLTLVAIAAAFIVPEMRGTREAAGLRASARQLISASTLAYSQAISRNETHRIVINPRTGHYAIERQMRSKRVGGVAEFRPATDLPSSGQGKIDARVNVEILSMEPEPAPGMSDAPIEAPAGAVSGLSTLVFHADGTAVAAEVRLRDTAGFKLAYRLNPITARLSELRQDKEGRP